MTKLLHMQLTSLIDCHSFGFTSKSCRPDPQRMSTRSSAIDFANFNLKTDCHGSFPSAIGKRESNRQSTIKYIPTIWWNVWWKSVQ